MTIREVKNSPKRQGEDERIAYPLDTIPWGGYDSGAAVVLKDEDGNDISLTNLSGLVSVAGDVITTPLVINLKHGGVYRLEILWVKSSNTLETFCEIIGEK